MANEQEVQKQQDLELRKQLEEVDWHLDFGNVKIQVREGRPTQVTVERTVRLDN